MKLFKGKRRRSKTPRYYAQLFALAVVLACIGSLMPSMETDRRASSRSATSLRHTAAPRVAFQATSASQAKNPAVQNDLATLNRLAVAPENRCSPYDSDDYPYPQSVELEIIRRMGGRIYGPYTGATFSSRRQTDIEHIVAKSEAHDSGLCAASAQTRSDFSSDLLNLTLASPTVNRQQKSGKDFAEWKPALNRCWFASAIVRVKAKYRLSVDSREKAALEKTLRGCSSVAMHFVAAPAPPAQPASKAEPAQSNWRQWDSNGNGRITCAEARAAGIAPVRRGHPAYPYMDDRNNDGIVCE